MRQNKRVSQFVTEVNNAGEDKVDNDDNYDDGHDDDDATDEQNIDELEEFGAHLVQVNVDLEKDNGNMLHNFLATPDDHDNVTAYAAMAQNSIILHALNGQIDNDFRCDNDFFYGIMIDTGCARASSGGLLQYRAYCRHVGGKENIDITKTVFCKFGISGRISIGCAIVKFPMNKIILQFNIHIIDDDVPLLLSLASMDRLRIFDKNLTNLLLHNRSEETTQVKRFYGHPLICWDALQQSFFTYTELKRLQKRFGHPHVDKLFNLLKRSELENVDADTRARLEHITRRCKPCHTYAQAPCRFKFALREYKEFNHTVFVDIFYINSKPVLHVVVESIRYQAARWLSNAMAESVWRGASVIVRFLPWSGAHCNTRRRKAVRC